MTSYDYDAPISESGQTTPKYHALRKMMRRYSIGEKIYRVPPTYKARKVAPFTFKEYAPLFANLPEGGEERHYSSDGDV